MSTAIEDYRVALDAYSGPLDLLLFLVRRHEIDLNDIPVAVLTERYLAHLQALQQVDVNIASEFLVMAATLLEIKSAMLMPQEESPDGESEVAETLDSRYELVQQLLAYKRFKDAAWALDDRRIEWQARFARQPAVDSPSNEDDPGECELAEIDLEDVHILDLCEAFARILKTIGHGAPHEVTYDDTPIALHADDILDRLQREGLMTLEDIFVGRASHSEMIGLFLAVLELMRRKEVHAVQEEILGPINLEICSPETRAEPETDGDTDWRDPRTGQIQYEWPSEQIRERVEQRAKQRARAAARHEFAATPDEPKPIIVDLDEAELSEAGLSDDPQPRI